MRGKDVLHHLYVSSYCRSDILAERGANAFYTGPIARDIVAKVRRHPTNPGLLTLQDLARYKAKVRAPLCTDYRRSVVCGMPPPS